MKVAPATLDPLTPSSTAWAADMGYMLLYATCCNCKQPMTCNPDLVPSLMIDGKKEPLCEPCTLKWEKIHGKTNTIKPGAYEAQEVDY